MNLVAKEWEHPVVVTCPICGVDIRCGCVGCDGYMPPNAGITLHMSDHIVGFTFLNGNFHTIPKEEIPAALLEAIFRAAFK